ncbi:dihydroneopterin aldolase, partial [Cognatishimia sp.]|uniref:dihydroneopterin aldolase n=1 Tax=Cognatishimia sp. TaxID=2211648 RepID=UPI0035139EE9|nr:dihydroneopterin aldolase [Cognatishimia sp.]
MSASAFDHPEARAKATAPEGVHDRLSLRDHIVSVEIGAFQAERDMEQRLSFDVVVEVAAPEADLGDDVDLILSYDRITWAIEHELAAERLNLLETLAERIADRILAEPLAMRVFVRIQKLDKGNGALGVEIERVPGQGDGPVAAARAPVVAFLSNAALLSP